MAGSVLWDDGIMPKNRNLTFGDQQAQAAREKKLAKLKPAEPKQAEQPAAAPAKKSVKKKPSSQDL
jgi:hypothetical protein